MSRAKPAFRWFFRIFLAVFLSFNTLAISRVPSVMAAAVDRAQDDYDDAKKVERDAKKDYGKCVATQGSAGSVAFRQADTCEEHLQQWMAAKPIRKKWLPADEKTYADMTAECRRFRDSAELQKGSCDELKDQWLQAQQDAKDVKRKLERAQDRADQAEQPDKKGPPGNENCVECNKEKQKYQGKTGWESFADIVKAVTPLGLGAMNTYSGVKAMNLQSSDYQTYASSMSAAGLPFSQNTNGYGSIVSSMSGGNNMLSMLSMMNNGSGSMGSMFGSTGTMGGMSGMSVGSGMMGGMSGMSGGYGMMGGMSGMSGGYGMMGGMSGMSGGYGMMGGMSGMSGGYGMMGGMSGYPTTGYGGMGSSGYGGSLGMNGFSPYSNSGTSPYMGSYGGLTSYNPWSSSYNSQLSTGGLSSYYSNQQNQYGAQLRMAEQGGITYQDSQSAQQALYAAQTRYQQVSGNIGGSYSSSYYPYSTSYYGSGYGGTSSGYSYYPSYSYSPYGYSGSSYGTVNNPPALNATRQ